MINASHWQYSYKEITHHLCCIWYPRYFLLRLKTMSLSLIITVINDITAVYITLIVTYDLNKWFMTNNAYKRWRILAQFRFIKINKDKTFWYKLRWEVVLLMAITLFYFTFRIERNYGWKAKWKTKEQNLVNEHVHNLDSMKVYFYKMTSSHKKVWLDCFLNY